MRIFQARQLGWTGHRIKKLTTISFLIVVYANCASGREAMSSPPPTMSKTEYLLLPEELSQLNCLTAERRRIAQGYEGVALSSERASRSEEFGYIFRYDLVSEWSDPEGRKISRISILVIWSHDCKQMLIAPFP